MMTCFCRVAKEGSAIENKPNLFLIGTAKAATTSLAAALGQHPGIFVPRIKEPHYLSEGFPPERQSIVRCIKDVRTYNKLYTGSARFAYRLDASTSYLCSDAAASAIRKLRGKSVIVVLRDPISRYISHYQNDYSDGSEERSLNEVLQHDLSNEDSYGYLDYGLYAKHLDTWVNQLGDNAIICLDYDELINSSATVLDELYCKLGLEIIKGASLPSENSASVPANTLFARLLRAHRLRRCVRSVMPLAMRETLRRKFMFKSGKLEVAAEEQLLVELKKRYSTDFSTLRSCMGRMICVGRFSFLSDYV